MMFNLDIPADAAKDMARGAIVLKVDKVYFKFATISKKDCEICPLSPRCWRLELPDGLINQVCNALDGYVDGYVRPYIARPTSDCIDLNMMQKVKFSPKEENHD